MWSECGRVGSVRVECVVCVWESWECESRVCGLSVGEFGV